MARRPPSSSGAWLPHLAGGASVWRLAADLNAPAIFDGRLLVPEVRGPEELPDEVQWNHTDLVPLRDAIVRDREAVRRGLADLCRCLDLTRGLFEEDGYEDFEEAFTLPSVEADDGAHYFWRDTDGKVMVQNWGASPRSRAAAVVVYDRLHWDAFRRSAEAVVGPLEPAPSDEARGAEADPPTTGAKSRRGGLLVAAAVAVVAAAAGWALTRRPAAPVASAPAPSGPAIPAPPAPSATAAPAPPIPAPHQTILFALGRPDFDESQLASLEAIADYLERHPQVTLLRIEGHADYLGLEHENQPLSQQRAHRVARWLVDRGVDEGRLAPVGCSERYPLDEAESAEARRRNRRVEFFVVEPAGVAGPRPHPRCEP